MRMQRFTLQSGKYAYVNLDKITMVTDLEPEYFQPTARVKKSEEDLTGSKIYLDDIIIKVKPPKEIVAALCT